MAFDKDKFVTDFTDKGMEESQAQLLAANQADILLQLASKQDVASMQGSFASERKGLRRDMDGKITVAAHAMRREMSEQTQKTRQLIDDVQTDVKRTEARLDGTLKRGFAVVNAKFNVLALSNTAVVLSVIGFMYFLMRG